MYNKFQLVCTQAQSHGMSGLTVSYTQAPHSIMWNKNKEATP